MKENTVVSKHGSQFFPMVPVVLFLLCVPIVASEAYLLLVPLLVTLIITFTLKKRTRLNIMEWKVKDGLFEKWQTLPKNGYISIFYETEQMLAQARIQTTLIQNRELKLNYICERKKYLLYTAKDDEDAFKTAKIIAEAWEVRIYNGNDKIWLVE